MGGLCGIQPFLKRPSAQVRSKRGGYMIKFVFNSVIFNMKIDVCFDLMKSLLSCGVLTLGSRRTCSN